VTPLSRSFTVLLSWNREPVDLAGGQIPVLYPLPQVVLVDGIAEVPEVVGAEPGVGPRFRGVLSRRQLTRGGGQPDLDRLRVSRENLGPFPPCRAVTFVDDDVAEISFRVVVAQEIRRGVHIPTQSGHHSEAKPATVPT